MGSLSTELCEVSGKPNRGVASMTKLRRQLVPVAKNLSEAGWIKTTGIIVRRIFLLYQSRRVQSSGNS